MKWIRYDGIYYTEDKKFSIIKATDRVHGGDWELYDEQTKEYYWKTTLKECKYIAENIGDKKSK